MSVTPQERSAAHVVLDVLASWGVRDVFTCPGSTEAPFLDASLDRPDLNVWLTPHELTAVTMADGYARFAGGTPGVAYLHTNVGLANGLGGVYAAQLAHSPVVVLNGLKARSIQSKRGFTAPPDVGAAVAPYARWRWQSLRTEEVATDLTRALQVATTEPGGPVWLGLPEDLLARPATEVTTPSHRSRAVSAVRPDAEAVATAATLLARARKPLLVAGADVARHGACAQLVRLAERLGAVVVHEDRRAFERSAFPTDHTAYAGFYASGHPAVRDADLVAFLGGRCFHEFEEGSIAPPADDALVIHSNADPVELGKAYGADVALSGDHRALLTDLLAALDGNESTTDWPPSESLRPPLREHASGQLTVHEALDVLATHVDDRTRIVADATTSNAALFERIPQAVPDQVVTTSCGALGWGTGAALGVQVARPQDRVVSVTGDGSLQFGVHALWVAARRRLPVTFVVLNNESYAAVAAALRRYDRHAARSETYPGKDIAGADLATVAEGFGVHGVRVHEIGGLRKALADALADDRPRLVEVMTDPADLGP
ncbi:MAG: thiamine pyrophosphate-binding protein [Streptosporangiales bacterium]|nr:thiamine pyrophosphate-binding protein [Streptosporangiales bacterium]MBO0891128.1 thiamine pyrophosphate-binding protein [Acidothermales bacterium]